MRITVKNKINFQGIGLHSGEESKIILHPYKKKGINFLRKKVRIPAYIDYKMDSRRGTILKRNSQQIETVEHLLSALYVLGIDDCLIEVVKGTEIPILDGSSYPFFHKIKDAGIEKKEGEKEVLSIKKKIVYRKKSVEIKAYPCKNYKINFLFDGTKFNVDNEKESVVVNKKNYENFSKARTFGFWKEIEYLKKNNLARGASLENVLIIREGSPYKTDFRLANELVKHKIIDFIGDMALLGKKIKGEFVIKRSGHYHNGLFMKKIMEETNGFN
ncbi:MAG: UDP-3-O-[3-hydroxymyristoyl] N-acetylglucosamine deacetylase [Candidatus Mcinerneyibacterium aminivorans]|uniref:UDP-3-O-acyl-N-acetylglucosamine deacetylase n=1 Tax=Candidatus Mcinerneyibacterium aminivorans TaxID=2703815 RepID=A0A5D0MFR9_9BACT|nr:MAG: UDP-3-O-[3-hydroxymyristoyl] N-acetylglucosamine deacetylase [Candidatus Mcinerneyibacterium aminivorans]